MITATTRPALPRSTSRSGGGISRRIHIEGGWSDRWDTSELAEHLRGWAPLVKDSDLRADLLDAADAIEELNSENQRLTEEAFL